MKKVFFLVLIMILFNCHAQSLLDTTFFINMQIPGEKEQNEIPYLAAEISNNRNKIKKPLNISFNRGNNLSVIGDIDFDTNKFLKKKNKRMKEYYVITANDIDFPKEKQIYLTDVEIICSHSEKFYFGENKYVYSECRKITSKKSFFCYEIISENYEKFLV